MDFNEFRDDIASQWQKRLIKLCWIGSFVVFSFELIVFVALYKTDSITSNLSEYLLVRMALPSGLNFITTLIASGIMKSNRYTVSQKNMISSFAIFVLGAVVSIFHNFFRFLLVAEGLPIIISAVFADIKILKKLFIFSMCSFVCAITVMWFDEARLPVVDFVTTSVCAFMFLMIVYTTASSILSYQTEQINFIYNSSQRQIELIHELKIEPLTKLYNRSALNEALHAFVRKYNEGIFVPHLVLIDLDHFKSLNDTYGHSNGDKVLIKLASIIKRNLGSIRRAFRYGGEEFVLLFEHESTEEVYGIIESIRKDLENTVFDFAPEKKITLSAGIAKIQRNWDDTTWFSAADDAMYRVKEGGRNSVQVADD